MSPGNVEPAEATEPTPRVEGSPFQSFDDTPIGHQPILEAVNQQRLQAASREQSPRAAAPEEETPRRLLSSEQAIEDKLNQAIEKESSHERKHELRLFKKFLGGINSSNRRKNSNEYVMATQIQKVHNQKVPKIHQETIGKFFLKPVSFVKSEQPQNPMEQTEQKIQRKLDLVGSLLHPIPAPCKQAGKTDFNRYMNV